MEMRDRIRAIRTHKNVNMTQAEFSVSLGLAPTSAASWEKKSNPQIPTESMRILICTKFGVNRTWLETGDGDMFEPATKSDETARMIESVSNSPAMRSLLATWAQLSDENKAAFEAFAADYVEDYNRRRTEQALSVDQAIVDDAAASIQPQSIPYADQQAQ